MKTLFIDKAGLRENDFAIEEEFINLINDFKILESHVIYFSAGDCKIKEILVKKDPSYSV